MLSLNCLVVGDKGSGKTCLIIVYTTNGIPCEYIPEVFENYAANVMVDGKPISLNIIDTIADRPVEERIELYSMTNVILICFDLNAPETFYNVKTKWKKEIDLYCSNVPYMLLGNKSDIRDDFFANDKNKPTHYHNYLIAIKFEILIIGYIHKQVEFPQCLIDICYNYYFVSIPITTEQGKQMMKNIGATNYMEHSLWSQYCKSVFDELIRAALQNHPQYQRNKKSKRCNIM
eukprot:496747_1